MEAKAMQIKIINQVHYNYHHIISLKNFESKFSKIDRRKKQKKYILKKKQQSIMHKTKSYKRKVKRAL